MFRPPVTPWLRTLRDVGWVLLVLGLGAVAYLLVAGYGEGAVFTTAALPPKIPFFDRFLTDEALVVAMAVVVGLLAAWLTWLSRRLP